VATLEFRTTALTDHHADLLILPVFEKSQPGPGVREAGRALETDLAALMREQRFRGSVGESLAIPSLGRGSADTVLLLGLGPKAEAGPDRIRRAMGRVASRAVRARRVATTLGQVAKRDPVEAAQAVVEGLFLGSYRFDRYKGAGTDDDGSRPVLRTLTVLGTEGQDARAIREAMRRGEVLAEAAGWARDLVNTPGLDATPAYLAREAQKMARRHDLRSKVWGKAELEKGGFGGILGVGSGSPNTPRLIELRYEGGTGAPIALAGKGITFDSGGLSIKDAKGMEWMKADMAGAAAVLAAMQAIAVLKPKVNVVAVAPCAENFPGGASIRPGDVLRHRGGRTTEVLNTDAEGRLVLADALAFLVERKPRCIVDAATLTGACMIALGDELWGVMGSDRRTVRALLDAGEAAGEPGWELPLWPGYRKQLESSVADAKNVGQRYGGAITAAMFLKDFVGDVPWAHLDIAGVAFSERGGDLWPRGATGIPVRTLVRFVEAQAEAKAGARAGTRSRASGRARSGGRRAPARRT